MPVYKARIIGEFEIEAESLEAALESIKQLNAALTADKDSLALLGVIEGSWRAVKEDMVLQPDAGKENSDEP